MYNLRSRVLYSKCLGIDPVRYDRNIVFDNFAEIIKKYVDIIAMCPGN